MALAGWWDMSGHHLGLRVPPKRIAVHEALKEGSLGDLF